MRLTIKSPNMVIDSKLKSHIERRVLFVFSRSKQIIQSITVTLTDINGPKGGEDKQCKVKVQAQGLPTLLVLDEQANLMAALNSALSRVSNNLLRKVKRKQQFRDSTIQLTGKYPVSSMTEIAR